MRGARARGAPPGAAAAATRAPRCHRRDGTSPGGRWDGSRTSASVLQHNSIINTSVATPTYARMTHEQRWQRQRTCR
eukprot:1903136-Alexandrium_andersonii.AAC.1